MYVIKVNQFTYLLILLLNFWTEPPDLNLMFNKINLISYNIRISPFDEAKHSDNLNDWEYRKMLFLI